MTIIALIILGTALVTIHAATTARINRERMWTDIYWAQAARAHRARQKIKRKTEIQLGGIAYTHPALGDLTPPRPTATVPHKDPERRVQFTKDGDTLVDGKPTIGYPTVMPEAIVYMLQ